jgi:hypothetical protein
MDPFASPLSILLLPLPQIPNQIHVIVLMKTEKETEKNHLQDVNTQFAVNYEQNYLCRGTKHLPVSPFGSLSFVHILSNNSTATKPTTTTTVAAQQQKHQQQLRVMYLYIA